MNKIFAQHGFFIRIIFFIIIISFQFYPASDKPITIVFRYDDFSFNIDIERYLINVFNEYNLPVSFGIVQGGNHLCSTDIKMLKEVDKKKEVEIAMHGYAHTSTELFGTYDEQYKLLNKGKKFLEKAFDTKVITFIPPFNRYSLNTLKALNALNFEVISSDKAGPFNNSKIVFLPETSSIFSLRHNIALARNLNLKCIIIVMFHHYDFNNDYEGKGKISEKEFANLLKWISQQNDIQVKTLGQASNLIRTKDFVNYNEIHSLSLNSYLPFNQHTYALGFYPSFLFYKSLKIKLYSFLIIYHLIVLAISLIISYLIFYKYFTKRIKLKIILSLLLLILLGFIIPERFLGTLLVMILGITIGIVLSNYRLKIKK